jgi:hypothetical protein
MTLKIILKINVTKRMAKAIAWLEGSEIPCEKEVRDHIKDVISTDLSALENDYLTEVIGKGYKH